jgi:hypothetical protein
MKVVHDLRAVLVPSRRRFALAKLIAFVRASIARERPTPPGVRVALEIDRDQDAAEMYTVAVWYTLTIAIYVAAFVPLHAPFAIAVSIAVTPWLVQFPFYISGGAVPAMRNRDNRTLSSVWMMSLLTVASAFVAMTSNPAHYVAWFFFAVLAINGISAAIMWLLRDRVRELEARCGLS